MNQGQQNELYSRMDRIIELLESLEKKAKPPRRPYKKRAKTKKVVKEKPLDRAVLRETMAMAADRKNELIEVETSWKASDVPEGVSD